MKKIFSLVVVLTMLFSAFAMTASAADGIKASLVVNGDDGKVGTKFTVDYVITGTSTLYATQVNISYDKDVVALWDTEYEDYIVAGDEAYAFTGSHIEDKSGRNTIWGQEVADGDINKGLIGYSISASGSKANKTVDLTAAPYSLTADDDYAFTVITINFIRKAEGDSGIKVAVAGDEVFNAANPGGVIMEVTNTSADIVDDGLVEIVNPSNAPIVEEPDFSATAAGTTITCTGKVDATVSNYGVEFTKESTVEGARAQKYYGAMPGDTVKDYNGSTTFTFGDWDGTFEIVLEGVHAGAKELNFFANDTIIADTTFTLTIAE